MKTFSEAVNAVLTRKVPVGMDEPPQDFVDNHTKYKGLHGEIQNDPETIKFCRFLLENLGDDMEPEQLLAIAFSHGVMIGCEMEKQELGGFDEKEASPEGQG